MHLPGNVPVGDQEDIWTSESGRYPVHPSSLSTHLHGSQYQPTSRSRVIGRYKKDEDLEIWADG